MGLTIYQKSVYSTIFNATMISRSVGKTFKESGRRVTNKSVKDFKVKVFKKIETLINKMDEGILTEVNIVDSIDNISDEFEVSFGQAQKPINVILKYHFYLTNNKKKGIEEILHCPIDSVILEELRGNKIRLTDINKGKYEKIQEEIKSCRDSEPKITFDAKWDKQHLKKAGIV